MIAIKTTGIGAVSNNDIEEFNREFTDNDDYQTVEIIVTDDEHEILSPNYNLEFEFGEKKYNTIVEAFNDSITDDSTIEFLHTIMHSINLNKFEQNELAKNVLLSTKDSIIYYKADNDNYWGSRVPEFDGRNELGKILVEIRDYIKEEQ
tara:strand:+ start:458 stop:904 length:447 start_codon:yes stop_codon:yes gene_type:complete